MRDYWTCDCGANLDHGEYCEDCECSEWEAMNRRYHNRNKRYMKNMEEMEYGIEREDYNGVAIY